MNTIIDVPPGARRIPGPILLIGSVCVAEGAATLVTTMGVLLVIPPHCN